MPTPTFRPLGGNPSTKEIQDYIVKLIRDLNFMLENLDTLNINRLDAKVIIAGSITALQIMANTITADKMSVSQLSAIAADLGTITAGVINAVTINGANINITQDVTIGNNLILGFGSFDRKIFLSSAVISVIGGVLEIDVGLGDIVITGAGNITIDSAAGDINLNTVTGAGKHVYANTILLA